MQAEVDAELDGVGALGEVARAASGRLLHGEGIVVRVGKVAAPEGDDH